MGNVTGGMIAASIIAGRALQPLEVLIKVASCKARELYVKPPEI
jgi:ABC-type protease/lipase transport system fused ATPase/permease subunit